MRIDRRGAVRGLTGVMVLIAGVQGVGAQSAARRIAVAAASDLQTVLTEVATRFERDTGNVATVSLGSSGNFFAQIQNGAPFDVFLSADIEYPRQLAVGGHADAKTL